MFTDPTGHAFESGLLGGDCDDDISDPPDPNDPPDEDDKEDDGNCSSLDCLHNQSDDEFGSTETPNPNIYALVVIVSLLHVAIVITEPGLVWGEWNFASLVTTVPQVGVPLEAVLVSASAAT